MRNSENTGAPMCSKKLINEGFKKFTLGIILGVNTDITIL
jgi:hypothetical protein